MDELEDAALSGGSVDELPEIDVNEDVDADAASIVCCCCCFSAFMSFD